VLPIGIPIGTGPQRFAGGRGRRWRSARQGARGGNGEKAELLAGGEKLESRYLDSYEILDLSEFKLAAGGVELL
jgi:hypothetical protein